MRIPVSQGFGGRIAPPDSPARRVIGIVAFDATAPLLDSRVELETNGCS